MNQEASSTYLIREQDARVIERVSVADPLKIKDVKAGVLFDAVYTHLSSDLSVDRTKLQNLKTLYDYTRDAMVGQVRDSGDDAITHPEGVMYILFSLGIKDPDLLAAGLSHDLVEDKLITQEQLGKMTSAYVVSLNEAVVKVKTRDVNERGYVDDPNSVAWTDEQRTSKKILDAAEKGLWQAAIIKLADVAHNSLTLDNLQPHEGDQLDEIQKQQAKARLFLRFYGPMARKLGAIGLARMIEDNAFRVLQPQEYAEISAVLKQSVDREMIKKISNTAREWTNIWGRYKKTFEPYEDWVDAQAIEIEIPSMYEIHQRLSELQSSSLHEKDYIQAMLPRVKILCTDNYELLKWHQYFSRLFGDSPEASARLLQNIESNEPVVRTVPMGLRGANQKIDVILSTSRMDFKPIYLLTAAHILTEEERAVAQSELDSLIDSYKVLTVESNPEQSVQVFEEILGRNKILIADKKGVTYSIARGATFADGAYTIGPRLGNDAIGGHIIRGDKRISMALNDVLEQGDRMFVSAPVKNVKPSPYRFDIVTTAKALEDINARIIGRLNHDKELQEQARQRGSTVIEWLYRMRSGKTLDIHPDYAFSPGWNDEEEFSKLLERIGVIPKPARDEYYDTWKVESTKTILGKNIRNAFEFVDHLIEFRDSCPIIRIHLADETGRLKDLINRAAAHDINIGLLTAGRDTTQRAVDRLKPMVIEAVLTSGFDNVHSLYEELTEFYKGKSVDVELQFPVSESDDDEK